MIIEDQRGNRLLDIKNDDELTVQSLYSPVTHALAVVKVGNEYLMGWNRWRKSWEIFGGCIEEGETIRECIMRECLEELGIGNVEYEYLGLMYYDMAPGYFNPQRHFEYGALYGVTLPEDALERIEKYRIDKEEIEKVSYYSQIKDNGEVALIDEKLLEYWSK